MASNEEVVKINIIPKFAIAICLKQFFEISQYGDPEGAEHFEKLVARLKSSFA